ncbi:hypothetical protein [Hydrogenophaga sp.]|uniref:hypothetical protein n=1 Tax=Hydrogenophaga sp. TaxID=1904254 RepID=UPI002730F381|nr:hypothetical protein [Hydrogenophaga sp.]MDP2015242.1 hypothetical protein [Hydrogenophaga sp.]
MLLKNLVDVLEQSNVANVFREFATDIAWLTGSAALGQGLSSGQYIEVTVRMKHEGDGLEGMSARTEALEAQLNKIVQRKIVLKSWLKSSDPDPALEGFIRIFGL